VNTDHVVMQGNDIWCRACDAREPLRLPLSVKALSHFVQTWAEGHRLCAAPPSSLRGDKLRAAVVVSQVLSSIARLGPEAEQLALAARDAFNRYQMHDPTTLVQQDGGRSVCLHCGNPYENKED